jgi:hypothetical protein
MHPLAQGVTVVVTPRARLYGMGLRRQVPLAELVAEAVPQEARKRPAETARERRN